MYISETSFCLLGKHGEQLNLSGIRNFSVAQWVNHTALSLLQLGSLLWCGFDSWPGNFHIPRSWPKKKKKKKKKSVKNPNQSPFTVMPADTEGAFMEKVNPQGC